VPEAVDYRSLQRFAGSMGVVWTEVCHERIASYFGLLAVWNRRLRLTGIRETQLLIDKQAADAVAVVSVLPHEGSLLDIGTGAGLPGLVIACLRPDLDITLLDSRERPISFLREVTRALSLSRVRVERMRAEEAPTALPRYQVAVSCAVQMASFFQLASPLLARDGIAISLQTADLEPEVARAAASAASLRLSRTVPYRVPAGDRRCLVVATAR
jgi:16S rRNA (guanine527-N7)-methyltransferase